MEVVSNTEMILPEVIPDEETYLYAADESCTVETSASIRKGGADFLHSQKIDELSNENSYVRNQGLIMTETMSFVENCTESGSHSKSGSDATDEEAEFNNFL